MNGDGALSFEAAFAPFVHLWRDPWAEALSHKAKGGRVVGYMTPAAPRELIEAAGFMPLRLDGVAMYETPNADRIMERLFDPGVRSVCELALSGALDFLDGIVLPRTPDSVQRLYYYLCEAKRGGARLPELLFFDLLHTPWYSSAEYNFARLAELMRALERLAARPIAKGAVAHAIAAANRRSTALRSCLAARPDRLTGGEAMTLMAGVGRMADEVDTRLAALARALDARAPHKSAVRLMLTGNAPDTLALHDLVQDLGATIVHDRHAMGEGGLGSAIDEAAPPLRALCDHYHRAVFSARTFDAKPEDVLHAARAVAADGVIFLFHAEEEVLTWDYPAQRAALESAGVAQLCLSAQAYRIDPEEMQPRMRNFIAPLVATGARQ